MKLIEFSAVKGGPIWVNPALVLYVGLPDGAGSSMYGDNNVRTSTRLHFTQGSSIEVKEGPSEVVSRLTA
jgi:hypothetical protein